MKVQAPICCFLVTIALGIFGSCVAAPEDNAFEEEMIAVDETKLIADALRLEPAVVRSTSTRLGKPRASNVNVTFNLYTKWNPTTPDVFKLDEIRGRKQLRSSYFDAARLTIFVTHGWMENGKSELCTRLRDEYLAKDNVNVVVVDWHGNNYTTYESAAGKVNLFGEEIARFLDYLVINAHLELHRVTLVGYSMGAHIMGIASKKAWSPVNTIVGLDPALHEFKVADRNKTLNRDSANYVQIIHTNGDHYGHKEAIGHADFYANGGIDQPGCDNDHACSHKRAWEYFAESINSQYGFYGEKCSSYEHLVDSSTNEIVPCDLGVFGKMGGLEPNHDIQEIFHLDTRAAAPYAIGML